MEGLQTGDALGGRVLFGSARCAEADELLFEISPNSLGRDEPIVRRWTRRRLRRATWPGPFLCQRLSQLVDLVLQMVNVSLFRLNGNGGSVEFSP